MMFVVDALAVVGAFTVARGVYRSLRRATRVIRDDMTARREATR